MADWLAPLLLVVVALLAVALFSVWRRAQRADEAAGRELALARRLLAAERQAAAWHAAELLALQAAQPDPVLFVSADRTVLSLNPPAAALFGPQAATGQTLILHTRSVELDDLAAHCLAGGSDCDRQLALGAGHVPHRARAVPIGGPDGQPRGLVLVLQDLSELQRLGRARRDFVANISHELRTPISSIRLLVDTLRAHQNVDAAARDELLEKIHVETEALAQLSQELLDLAQIESGQALVRLVPEPVAELVSHVAERLGPQAERKQIALAVSVPEGLRAWADAAQLTRALSNLVHNAIKFTPPGGTVRVSALAANGDVTIEVSDTGPGIAPEDLPRVFERFFRGDRARASGGTGLGLAIAKHVVEAHGGRLWVESEGRPGQGATFRFTLAAAEPDDHGPPSAV